MQGLQSQEALFGIASRKWLAQFFLNFVDDIIIAKMPSNDYAIQGQQY